MSRPTTCLIVAQSCPFCCNGYLRLICAAPLATGFADVTISNSDLICERFQCAPPVSSRSEGAVDGLMYLSM